MNDSSSVRGIERGGDLDAKREQSVQFHGTPRDALLQGCAIQKLHSNERFPVLFTNVIDRADVWVIQRGRSLRFSLEAGQGLWVSGHSLSQKLKRNEAMETRILSFVNDSHPAAAELLNDAIMR